MIDILEAIFTSQVDEHEAGVIFDKTVEDFHLDRIQTIQSELCLNDYEWTAVCQGVPWIRLALWRYTGWPTVCSRCGEKINYIEFGWLIDSKGFHHVKCQK